MIKLPQIKIKIEFNKDGIRITNVVNGKNLNSNTHK